MYLAGIFIGIYEIYCTTIYNMWGGQVKSENYVHNYKAFYGKLFNHKIDQYNYALNFRF